MAEGAERQILKFIIIIIIIIKVFISILKADV
jgi:hypothetical protein